jgi:hypothetical protein
MPNLIINSSKPSNFSTSREHDNMCSEEGKYYKKKNGVNRYINKRFKLENM